jgi:hypothetical protein
MFLLNKGPRTLETLKDFFRAQPFRQLISVSHQWPHASIKPIKHAWYFAQTLTKYMVYQLVEAKQYQPSLKSTNYSKLHELFIIILYLDIAYTHDRVA